MLQHQGAFFSQIFKYLVSVMFDCDQFDKIGKRYKSRQNGYACARLRGHMTPCHQGNVTCVFAALSSLTKIKPYSQSILIVFHFFN